MEKLLDQNYPEPFDAGVLKSPDPFLNKVLQSQLRKLRPELFDWHWQRGAEIQIGEGKRKDFWDPSFWWISRKFKAGTGRIYRDLNTSHAVNFADLGNGWRLLCGGIDPNGKERSRKQIFLLDFLYQDNKAKPTFDGTSRLIGFIHHLAKMPNNPFNFVLLQPVGAEILDIAAPHYDQIGYRKTGHDTDQLKTIYKRLLKARPTEVFADPEQWEHDRYWLSEIYQPKDPSLDPKECPYFGRLQ